MNQLVEFAANNDIQVDQLYIDRFWESMYNDRWLYIDSEIVRWIGYDDPQIRTGKDYILRKLRKHFIETKHFKLVKLEDADECKHIPTIDFDTIHAKHLLIVELDTFKELLLTMSSPKARQVQKYFIQVEKLCRKFMAAQINRSVQNIERMKLAPNECVYVISNNRNTRMNLYKIGKTRNLKSRLSSLNTSNPDRVDDRLRAFAVIKCFDSKSLEAMIHAHLDAYRHSDSKEWFQIEYASLMKVVEHFQKVSESNINLINELDSINEMKIEPEVVQIEPEVVQIEPEAPRMIRGNTNACPSCSKSFRFSNSLFEAHVIFCKKNSH